MRHPILKLLNLLAVALFVGAAVAFAIRWRALHEVRAVVLILEDVQREPSDSPLPAERARELRMRERFGSEIAQTQAYMKALDARIELVTRANEHSRAAQRAGTAATVLMSLCVASAGVAYGLHQRQIVKRLQNGLCLCCGYDVRSSPERCPECGSLTQRVA